MSDLHSEVKQMIIDVLALEDVSLADIDDAAPLFGDGLGLDSIDALELGLALKKRYNIKLSRQRRNQTTLQLGQRFGGLDSGTSTINQTKPNPT